MSTTARTQSAFASRDFTLFFAGQSFGYIGDGLRTIAIPLLVFHLTHSGLSLGITYVLEFLPFTLFGLVSGSLADRLDRRRLMIVCDAIRCAVLVVFALAYWRGTLTLGIVYGGITLMSICASAFVTGQSTSIPFLLGKDRAKSAVSALFGMEQATNMIVPPIGGALFAVVGPLPALVTNAATYLISQLSLASIHTLGPDDNHPLPSPRTVVSDIRASFTFIFGDPALARLASLQCAGNVFGFMGFAAIVPYIKREFVATDQQVGIAFGVFALGAALGSLVAGKTHLQFGRALILGMSVDALAWIPLAFSRSLGFSVALIAVGSAFSTYFVTNNIAWRMRIIPEEMVGRVFGAIRVMVMIGSLPGALIGGWGCDHWGSRTVMLISAVGYLAMAVAVVASPILRREAR